MNAYFFNMTPEERESILDKHKHIYNGYQTLQPNIPNPQPLYVQDFANDKEGITVSNKGEVMSYRNMNINESVEKGDMCECGGMVYEGECMECGKAYKTHDIDIYDVKDLNPKNKFDYVEGKDLEEVRVADLSPEKTYKMKFPTFKDVDDYEEKDVKYKGTVNYPKGRPMHSFKSLDDLSGAMLSGTGEDDDISQIYPIDEMESNYDYKLPAYQFQSKGPIDAYDEDDKNYFEDSIDIFSDEDLDAGRAFSDMDDEDEWSDEKILMNLRKDDDDDSLGTDTKFDMDLSDVKDPYTFASGGPGRSIGVYEEEDLDEGYFDWDLGHEFEVKKDTNLPKGHGNLKKGDKVKLIKKWKNANPGKHGDIFYTDKSEDRYGLSRDDIQYLSSDNEELDEKWDSDVKVKKTGEYAGKTLEELQKELASLKEKSKKYQDNDEDVPQDIVRKEAQVKFAIRAKRNWPKGHMEEQSIEEMVDEDLKESFVKQKDKITEMFQRMRKF